MSCRRRALGVLLLAPAMAGAAPSLETHVLPGRLEALVTVRREGGERVLLLLREPEGDAASREDPCATPDRGTRPRLWQWDGVDDPQPVEVDLPAEVASLAVTDLDGDGFDEVLLQGRSSLWRLEEGGADPTLLLGPQAFDLGAAEYADPAPLELARGSGMLAVPRAGHTDFRRLRPGPDGLPEATRVETPTRHERRRDGLTVTPATLRHVGVGDDGRERFATAPETFGDRRVRVLLADPEAEREEDRAVDCWARFPEPERMTEWFLRVLDGGPVLALTTMPADRLSLFGEKRLRVFRLEPDRSRMGRAPLAAFETRVNVWQPVRLLVRDLDEDGRDDLTLGYWKGIRDDRVVLDIYPQEADGGFRKAPWSTGFDVKNADRSYLRYGDDLDGDGRPDLLLLADGRLRVHRGREVERLRKESVDRKPWISLPLGDALPPEAERSMGLSSEGVISSGWRERMGSPRPVDLDGDGVAEILFARQDVAEGDRPAAARIGLVRTGR